MSFDSRAVLSTAEVNNLPDSAFAYIEPGGKKDSSGKTMPRSLRHFPIHDAAHVRNALARIAQGAKFGQEALPKVKTAAAKFGIDVGSGNRDYELMFGTPERRYTPGAVDIRTAPEGRTITGYGAVFGKLSRNLGGFVERVGDGAFNASKMRNWPNVVCRYNHDANMVLGTTAGHTLQLKVDDMGLYYEVLPPQSRMDILELVERGDVQHSSFAFRVPPGGDEWSVTEQNYPMRTLNEVQLVDVAPVLDPAYPDATAGLRSLAMAMDAPFEEVCALAADDELRKFFVRTDRSTGKPVTQPKPKKTLFGPQAAMKLLERREDPWVDES